MNQLNTSTLFKPYLDGSGGYTGGPGMDEVKASVDRVYKLSSNENPIGPSPKALNALREASQDIHIYPDRTPIRMQEALARYYQNQLSLTSFWLPTAARKSWSSSCVPSYLRGLNISILLLASALIKCLRTGREPVG